HCCLYALLEPVGAIAGEIVDTDQLVRHLESAEDQCNEESSPVLAGAAVDEHGALRRCDCLENAVEQMLVLRTGRHFHIALRIISADRSFTHAARGEEKMRRGFVDVA